MFGKIFTPLTSMNWQNCSGIIIIQKLKGQTQTVPDKKRKKKEASYSIYQTWKCTS